MPSNSNESAEPQPSPRGCMGTSIAVLTAMVSATYLANFTMGIWEIPDNFPIVGNLDEVFFSGLLFSSLGYLGIHLPFLRFPMRKEGGEQIQEQPREQRTTVESTDDNLS